MDDPRENANLEGCRDRGSETVDMAREPRGGFEPRAFEGPFFGFMRKKVTVG